MRLVTPTAAQAALLEPQLTPTHVVLDGARTVGGLAVVAVRPGTSSLSFWVVPSERHRGVATWAVRELCHAGASRLELVTDIADTASQRVALGAGFTREAVLPGGSLREGSRHDAVLWAWLPGDPVGPAARLLPDLPDGVLRDGEVTLRPLGPGDAADVLTLENTPDVLARSILSHERTRQEIERKCAAAGSSWLAGVRAQLAVEVDCAFAGMISLFSEPLGRQAMIGYSLLPEFRGRGVATCAVRLLSSWALEIGVRRLIAGTAPDNAASQRVLAKAGFVREGIQRSRFDGPHGTRVDDVIHVLLPEM